MHEENDSQSMVEAPDPLEVMRRVLEEAEFVFREENGAIHLNLALNSMDITVVCLGEAGDLASVIVTLPVRAPKEFRAATGEFLHRLNYCAKRKFWEIDYTDGQIHLAAYTDLIGCPLKEDLFRSMFHAVTTTADVTFPYLSSVIFGRMSPEFAADQAEAAIQAFRKGED